MSNPNASNPYVDPAAHTATDWHHLSAQQLQALGMNLVAYVKPVAVQGGATGFAIHAADGTPVAVMVDRAHAIAVVLENDLEPVSLH